MAAAVATGALLLPSAAVAAKPAADPLTTAPGRWVTLFAPDIERAVGYSVRVDAASVAVNGLVRSFRQVQVFVRAEGQYAAGTTVYQQRSVDCAGGRVVTTQWRVLAPSGAVLGGAAAAGTPIAADWNTLDGKVLRYVCAGALPR